MAGGTAAVDLVGHGVAAAPAPRHWTGAAGTGI